MLKINEIYNQDCLEGIKLIDNNSIDCILTDPPYLYLDHKLDRDFNEDTLFSEWKRVLKKDGFVVVFGRGTSFYRWNTKLANLGFKFKEEIVWNKRNTSSPLLSLSRIHETVSIHTLGNGLIKKSHVPYLEARKHNIDGIIMDIKQLKTVFSNVKNFEEVEKYLKSGKKAFNKKRNDTFETTIKNNSAKDSDKTTNTLHSVMNGMIEKSIIEINSERLTTVHPTQKPDRLLERLLALTTEENALVLDCFAGSGSTLTACIKSNRNFIGFEIDFEYFSVAKKRISETQRPLF